MLKYLHKKHTDDETYKETKTTASLRVHFVQPVRGMADITVHVIFTPSQIKHAKQQTRSSENSLRPKYGKLRFQEMPN
jgi:hypothetical protein